MSKKLLAVLWLLIIALRTSAQTPTLSFFNELDGKSDEALFADTSLIPTLQQLHAQIRMGMLDLNPSRASVVRQLNRAGIPVVAWLLLPKDQGYWFNSRNAAAAEQRYQEVKKWAGENGLVFQGYGLDLELDYNDLVLWKNHKLKLIGKLILRLYDKASVEKGREEYQALI